ncbi:hypothetical protein P8917_09945 [Bacillus atrophaeus]|uniref:hypothetical protein n=1 Tax=Bacillus atrophaeus TaxID=1452 RepID=UPI00227DA40C|nr:hypothetical protein [Bacillus atrophaeus]MCY8497765.1 hypothetical protein [Bacillus atrophaeus]MCY8814930.1 hypothetical protein [Bacillus atrophaeus]MCY8821568.1 hypothetical protein [Bacillus atrophaeus]MCY8830998.1 hypothetical protein [Bacillus atrophaeus]MCY8835213.1 hypothetical protein [Bacillus atrophaeus]
MEHIVDGRPMNNQEIKEFLLAATENPKYPEFLGRLNQEKIVDIDSMLVKASYIFDLVDAEQKTIEVGRIVVLDNEEHSLNVHLSSYENIENSISVFSFGGDILTNKVLKQIDIVGEDSVLKSEFAFEGDLNTDMEVLPYNNTSYTPGQTKEKIKAAWNWDEFCAPGGYKHCGKQCGDKGRWGGGKPINDLDYCCRTHDRCYDNFGFGHCKCDTPLVKCAKSLRSKYWIVANVIIKVFGPKAC